MSPDIALVKSIYTSIIELVCDIFQYVFIKCMNVAVFISHNETYIFMRFSHHE